MAKIITLGLFGLLLILYVFWRQEIKKEAKKLNTLEREREQLQAKAFLLLEAVKRLDIREETLVEETQKLEEGSSQKIHEIELLEQQIIALDDKKALLEQSSADYERNLEKTFQSMENLKKKELADKVAAMELEYATQVEAIKEQTIEIEKQIADKRLLIKAINEQLAKEEDRVQRVELPKKEYNTFKDAVSDLQQSLPLSFTKAMNKVLWTELVRRPTTDMVKRLTLGNRISGIYKITNTETGLSYIGRSVDVGNRLTEHVRSAVGASTTTQQQVHKEMGKNLLDWEFEILEQVPEERLGEREKFYIDFYDTVNTGYNRARGG